MRVFPLEVGSVEDAKKAISVGVDAIIVQGREAGGHVIGQVCKLLCVQIQMKIMAFFSNSSCSNNF